MNLNFWQRAILLLVAVTFTVGAAKANVPQDPFYFFACILLSAASLELVISAKK
jgi:hypothetical protein